MFVFRLPLLILLCGLALVPGLSQAQSSADYDPSWYDADAPHVQIDVTTDGVYHVSGNTIQTALPEGATLSDITRENLRLIENGEEIPIQVTGNPKGTFASSDTITFIGRRNRGTDEHWAYDYSRRYNQRAQSSTYHSLYSDTTTYWLTWEGGKGRRYEKTDPSSSSSSATSALRDTVHLERDNRYYFGRPNENGNSLYTESEGYFWRQFSHNDTSPISATYTLPVGRRTPTSAELDLSVRLDAATAQSCHRVEVEAELSQSDGSLAFESLQTVEWRGTDRRTVTTSVSQENIPSSGLTLRLTSYNDNFSEEVDGSSCPNPEEKTQNYVLLDWIEAAYTRSLEPSDNTQTQRFAAPAAQEYTFELSGYSSDTVHVYNPNDARRYDADVTNGTATVTDTPGTAPTPYWAVGPNSFRSPAAVRADAPSEWSDSTAHGADYLILTTEALRPSAQKLADYRASHSGYDVEIALVQNVFDEFDYGRPTPIAIRRFVRATQSWDPAPDFLTIFADAQYPIRDGSVSTLYPEWSVPSFGYSPSDGWFAMQTDGANDWSEILAIGRIPVRSVAQGDLFVEKLRSYEAAPLQRWQKRMLLLAGGVSESEQNRLQDYSNRWGEIASDTLATTNSYAGPVHTGMDTLRYYKNADDALDTSFQDSLSVDLERGAGWLNYFGHSGALTWEIVTDPPSEFDNAGQLPVVVSLGCRTGSFAGGRFEEKSAPSLGEELVVGRLHSDGTPKSGALNGGIAHFGESALGNLRPSARLNDALVQRVFVDTVRVLGKAIRSAKDSINAKYGNSSFYAKHLLQYGLLGDPATEMALPDKPDLHVAPNLISVEPSTPIPSDEIQVSVQVQNHGMIPRDSVDVHFTWKKPTGEAVRKTRRLQRVPLRRTIQFSDSLDNRAIGTNTFRVEIERANAEANTANNAAEQTQVVFDSGVSLISPIENGTVSSDRPSLRFTVPRQTEEAPSIVAQLDSVPDFSSPFRRQTTVEAENFVQSWQPSALESGETYYWRARVADAAEDSWRSSTFTVAPSLPDGSWLQQTRLFSSNANTRLQRSDQRWRFARYSRNVSALSERGGGSRTNGFKIDGADSYEYLQFGFGVLVMNGRTGRVKESESFPTYDLSDRFEDEVGDQQEAIDSLGAFLDEVAREGDYVFVRTRHLARKSSATIDGEVKNLFRNLGTTQISTSPHSEAIDSLSYGHLWTLKARKGHPEETVERVSPPSEGSDVNEIIHDSDVSFSYPSGVTLTPRIGPASDWSSLNWKANTPDERDALQIDVLAPDSTALITNLTGDAGQQSLDQIDAQAHPYLRLRATLSDSTTGTPPQLSQWSVAYEGVSEIAADPGGLRRTLPDTLLQGEDVSIALPVTNLGAVPSDSVYVQYNLTDASNSTRKIGTDTIETISSNTTDTSSVRFSTANMPGVNVLTVNAETTGPPERISTNNVVIQSFFVRRDRTPPSLEVFANGQELLPTSDSLNRLKDPSLPYVSTNPSLDIRLRDDNPHLSLADTSYLDVYLKGELPKRGESRFTADFQRISFAGSQLSLVSTDSSTSNAMRVRFEPSLPPKDSTYTLKVEATDAEGNEIKPYQGSFRIKPNQEIKDVYPYPNPMRTHTTFAFRVVGGENNILQNDLLRNFTLRIYTLSGRLVREFDQTDLRPLGPDWYGLRWNGRDEDGDRVATGVYLYQADVASTDASFEGEVEKITVIR